MDAALGYGSNQLFRRPGERPLAHLHIKVFPDELYDVTFPVTIGDYKFIFAVAEDMDGMTLTNAEAFVTTPSTAGDVIVGLREMVCGSPPGTSLLTDPLQVDEGECNSATSSAPVVIAAGTVAWPNEIIIDVFDPGAGAFGLGVILEFS